MKTALFVAVALLVGVGCGGYQCSDDGMFTNSVNGCHAVPGNSLDYCKCAADELYKGHSCQDIASANVSVSDLRDICRACGGGGC